MVDVIEFLDQFGTVALIALIVVILIIEVFLLSFPKEIVMIYAGLTFGTIGGGLINLIGLFGAAWLGYEGGLYGRFGLENRRNHPVIQKYQAWLNRNGFKALILFRLFPFTPNDILSISCGFSRLQRFPYLIITFITAIPYAFFIAYIGDKQLDQFIELLSIPEVFNPTTWIISFILIIIISWIIVTKGTNKSVNENGQQN